MIRKLPAVACVSLLTALLAGSGCSSDAPDASGGAGAAGAGKSGAAATAGAGNISGGANAGSPSFAGSAGSAGAPSGAGAGFSGGPNSAGSGGTFNGGAGASTSGAGGSNPGTSGAPAGGAAAGGAPAGTGCDAPNLVWKTGAKTNYTSYPEPGSEECVKYSGCLYEGLFAACDKKQTQEWVKTHNIVAAFPLGKLALHDLCLKSGNKTIVVTVYDTCGDDDCDGCCSDNKGSKDALIDIESFTNARWGVQDGAIQWADLGPTKTTGCAK